MTRPAPGPTRLPRKGGGFVRLRRKLARWAKDHLAELNTEPGEIPEELNDRAVDNWLGLFAIADCVGGPWPKRAREAALHLSTEVDTDGDEVGVLLLGDIHDYLSREENEDADRVTSEDLLDHLQGLDERPWGEWGRTGKPISAHQLARLLRPFGITTTAGRKGKRILRGYERAPLEDAFSRYLPAETSPESATVQQTARDKGKSSSARVQQKSVLHSGKTQKVQHSSDLLHCSTSKAANGAPRVENIGGFDYYHRTLADVKARLNSRKKHNA